VHRLSSQSFAPTPLLYCLDLPPSLLNSVKIDIVTTATTFNIMSLKPLFMNKKSVSFDTIEILQFGICLGDNPSVSTFSVPITIEWQAYKRTVLSVEAFENIRPPRQEQVRKFSPLIREQMLLDKGFSPDEIEDAVLEARGISYGRATSAAEASPKGLDRLDKIQAS
jgi:hypothetical protein